MTIREEIEQLKKEKDAVILAHYYVSPEVQEIADYVGDSFYLSKVAVGLKEKTIVFCGVSFMGESAKILNPEKTVLMPDMAADCPMAHMASVETIEKIRSEYDDLAVVCYINSTAEVKSECDICCTSSNAVKIVDSLKADEILFLPDTYLGKWVESQLGNVKVNTYTGFCPTHVQIRPNDVTEARKKYPNALVLAHPECHQSVVAMADYVGSTTGIMKFAAQSDKKEFIIATEKGVVDRLKRDYPEKEFYLIKDNVICPNMKWHTLTDIYNALDREEHEITVDTEIASKALKCIDRMLEVSAIGAK